MEPKKKKPVKILYVILPIIVVLGVACYYWNSSRQYETTDNAQLDGDILSIRASVTAHLDKIYFTDNQHIKKGDTLMRFNTVALQARVEQARATLASAQASIKVNGSKAVASAESASASLILAESSQQEIATAKIRVKSAQDDFTRIQKLFAIKAATQQQVESASTQLNVSQANLAEVTGRQKSSMVSAQGQKATALSEKAQIGSAEALLEQRKAELLLAQDELSHAYVVAPCSGIVTKRAVQQGHFVSTGQNLCAIVETGNIWVSANLKETQLRSIQIGQPVEIKVDAYPDLHLTGHVTSFGGATGAKFSLMPPDNASGNFVKIVQRVPVRISVDTPKKNMQKLLYPGLSAFVKIKTT